MQGVHDLWNSNQNIKLADWMIVVGVCNGIFSLSIPHLHNLRIWSALACACTIVFVVIVIGCAAYDGEHMSPASCCMHAASKQGSLPANKLRV